MADLRVRCMAMEALSVAAASWVATMSAAAGAAPSVCAEVQREIDELGSSADPAMLVALGPHFGPGALARLEGTAREGDPPASHAAYLAIGLSRWAAALEAIREDPPVGSDRRLSWALALLALGDGAGTGTITQALTGGTVEVRRRAAHALALMNQKRPRMILYEALQDDDATVRLVAAEVHVHHYSRRARRVLVDLLESHEVDFRSRAAAALHAEQHRFRPEELLTLPDAVALPVFVSNAVRRTQIAKGLRTSVMAPKPMLRSASLAALIALGGESPAMIDRWAKKAKPKFGDEVDGQAAMAKALVGTAGIEAIEKLARAQVPAAADVMIAFAGAGPPKNQLDPEHARQLARVVEGWIVDGTLDDERQARSLAAITSTDPPAGLGLARARLLGPEGQAQRVAIETMARFGTAQDVPPLMAVTRRATSPSIEAEGWRAASSICRR